MKADWIDQCRDLSTHPCDFFSGYRKIFRNIQFSMDAPMVADFTLRDIGYAPQKLPHLRRLYFHEESYNACLNLWEKRCEKRKYGSVSFTTYAHMVKHQSNKRGSLMGPCLQSVVITWLPDGHVATVSYRTTELLKKFPADLLLLSQLLHPFGLKRVDFFFANLTWHPMYWATAVPHVADPIRWLEQMRKKDSQNWRNVVKWTARYVCKEHGHGVDSWAQARRTRDGLLDMGHPQLKSLEDYLREHHPGYTRSRYAADGSLAAEADDDDDDMSDRD